MYRFLLIFLSALPCRAAAQCNPDLQPPVVTAFKNLAYPISAQSGVAEVSAKPLAMSATDNCDGSLALAFALRKAGSGTGFPLDPTGAPQSSISFSCAELGLHPVELWVRDQAGNAATVTTAVLIQDNSGVCLPSAKDTLCAQTLGGKKIENIIWRVDGAPGQPLPEDYTYDGCLLVADWLEDHPADSNLAVYPSRTEKDCNGLDVLDIYHLHRHILGLESLGNPLQMVAADINSSQSLTGYDQLIILQQVLMNNKDLAWRFFRTDSLPGANNPVNPFQALWLVPGSVRLGVLKTKNIDFVGVLSGDVDLSADPRYPPQITPPGAPAMFLTVPDTTLAAGDTMLLPFFLDQPRMLTALQIALRFDTAFLNVIGIEPGFYFKNLSSFALFAGYLTGMDYTYLPETIFSDTPLFSVKIVAKKTAAPGQTWSIFSTECLTPFGYGANLERIPVGLQFGEAVAAPVLPEQVWNCRIFPNPAAGAVWVETPARTPFRAEWYDGLGRLLRTQESGERPARLETGGLPEGVFLLKILDLASGRVYARSVVRRD